MAAPLRWDSTSTVAGFASSPPNRRLMEYASRLQMIAGPLRVLDIGCGAGRNAVPLACAGHVVMGTDLSWPMLHAAETRDPAGRVSLAVAPMDALPVPDRSVDLIVAHGIWNLARSGREFRRALSEAARVAAPGARLFVFTFSRHTLPADEAPVAGETFVFTSFANEPQVFLTGAQLVDELDAAGFTPDPDLPLRVLNLAPPGSRRLSGPPVIFEGGFTHLERQR
jgi:ubiquinone/menaquinone biosynthesis C-methylase UbiE